MTSNYIVPADAAPAVILNDISEARAAFGLSKDSAAKAAAYTYIVWRQSYGPHALPEAKQYISKAITDHNESIDAKAKKAGIVKISARDGANDFTEIVKYVLSFVHKKDASNVSRYAKALKWLDEQFGTSPVTGAGELVDAINKAGGFEAIQKNVNAKATSQVADDDTALKDEERKAINAFLVDKALDVLNGKPVVATVPLREPQGATWRLLVGRTTDQGVEIVEEVKATPETVYGLIGEDLLNTSASVDLSSQFVSRVLTLGTLVQCGLPSALTRRGNPHGDKLKGERVLSLRTVNEASVELMYSAKHADASTVIVARPKIDALNSCAGVQPVFLSSNHINVAQEMLTGPARSLVRFDAEVNPPRKEGSPAQSPLAWLLINAALEANKLAGAKRRLYWSRLSQAEYPPLAVEQPKFSVRAQLDVAQVNAATAELLATYANAKAGAEPVNIAVGNGQLTVQAGKSSDIVLAPAKGAVSIKMRGRDLHDLLNMLAQLAVPTVELALDSGGVLRISWSEDCGSFEVNMPTLDSHNELQTRRFAPMITDADSDAAVA